MRPIDADALELILNNAIEMMRTMAKALDSEDDPEIQMEIKAYTDILTGVKEQPTAQPERDIPIKPIETTDTAWGIPNRQAVCPKCDYYLGHVVFLGDYKGKKVTYCETCGQAIDWEGWKFDE